METKAANNTKTIYDMMDDIYKNYLWGLRFINLEKVWEEISEADLANIHIAVIDSGIEQDHEDLAGAVEVGYNFVDNNNNACDDFGHGTRVAGIIGAKRNNGLGVSGVASGVKLIPLKVMNYRGEASTRNVVRALEWAIDNRVDIINLSIGYQRKEKYEVTKREISLYEKEEELIRLALKESIAIVASVGNDCGKTMQYPARYEGIIPVASYGIKLNPIRVVEALRNNKTNDSTIFAPGEYIYTTDIENSYTYDFGSSMAAGFVSGAVAFLKAKDRSLTSFEILKILHESSRIEVVNGKGIRLLDVGNAIESIR